MTSESILSPNATVRVDVPSVIATYLRTLGASGGVKPEALIGETFKPEMIGVREAMDASTEFPRENWPRFALEWGFRLGQLVTVSALTAPPAAALGEISAALNDVRREVRQKVADAPRSNAEARSEKAAERAQEGRKHPRGRSRA